MVDRIKIASKLTVRKVENAYAVLAMACTAAAAVKVASMPKVHTSWAALPVWQFVAGVLLAGLAYGLFKLIDKE